MSATHNLGPAAGAALVTAVIFATASCGSLDRSVGRDHCETSSDCNRGRACVAGICEAPTDGGLPDAPVGAPPQDPARAREAGVETAVPVSAGGEAGGEASLEPPADAGIDASPAPADSGDDVAGRDPCATGPGQESPAAMPGLLAALPGIWRRCSTNTPVDPDVTWFVGSTRVVQLDARHWWRCADGVPPSCGATAQGLYFRVLEGSNSVFHFADSADPFNGGGADISIRYFPGTTLLQLTACDGASRCSTNSTNFVFVGPVPGS